jgi:hypothetical protein
MKEGFKKALGEVGEWVAITGPILATLGIMRAENGHDGKQKFVFPDDFVSHAKAHIFGIGVDDEAIVAAIFGQLNSETGSTTASKKIYDWLITLKKFQQARFR